MIRVFPFLLLLATGCTSAPSVRAISADAFESIVVFDAHATELSAWNVPRDRRHGRIADGDCRSDGRLLLVRYFRDGECLAELRDAMTTGPGRENVSSDGALARATAGAGAE